MKFVERIPSPWRDQASLMASSLNLESLLSDSPRLLPSSELHARLALFAKLQELQDAYRAELQRRPSHCRPPPAKKTAVASDGSEMQLLSLPSELLARTLALLRAPSLAACAQVSVAFHRSDEPQQPGAAAPQGLVEQALRLRAAEAGRAVPAALPEREAGWVVYLLWQDLYAGVQSLPVVAGGYAHTLFVDAEQRLLSCGGGDDEIASDVLGHGHGDIVPVPTPIPSMQGVRVSTVAASHSLSLAVTEAGQLYTWGRGCLGHSEVEEKRDVPTLVAAFLTMPVRRVAAGHGHILAVTISGALYSWGSGALDGGAAAHGHGSQALQPMPKRVEDLQGVLDVAAGDKHSLAFTSSALYSWGDGESGRLGHGNESGQLVPKRVEALQDRVCGVAAGMSHSLVVTSSGAVYSWGDGDSGRLGHGDESEQLVPKRVEAMQERACGVAAGDFHSLILTCSGAVYSCGHNDGGVLGHSDLETDTLLPTLIEGLDEKICAVTSGTVHAIATTTGGRAWGWGYGIDASLGLQLTDHQTRPLEYPDLRIATPAI